MIWCIGYRCVAAQESVILDSTGLFETAKVYLSSVAQWVMPSLVLIGKLRVIRSKSMPI